MPDTRGLDPLFSLQKSFINLMGYSELGPQSVSEGVFAIMICFLGSGLFAATIGVVNVLIRNLNSTYTFFRWTMDGLNNYMRFFFFTVFVAFSPRFVLQSIRPSCAACPPLSPSLLQFCFGSLTPHLLVQLPEGTVVSGTAFEELLLLPVEFQAGYPPPLFVDWSIGWLYDVPLLKNFILFLLVVQVCKVARCWMTCRCR